MSGVDLDILWAITMDEPVLGQVEEFLIHVGQPELSLKLNKLQQDVALEIANHLQDPLMGKHPEPSPNLEGLNRFLEDKNPDDLIETPVLVDAYEAVTPSRFDFFWQVEAVLREQGAQVYPNFVNLHADLKAQLPAPTLSSIPYLKLVP